MPEQREAYSRDDLDLDYGSASWVDGRLWFEGTTDDGRDISAGFAVVDVADEPRVEADMIATPQATAQTNRLFARMELELAHLHDPANKMDLGIK